MNQIGFVEIEKGDTLPKQTRTLVQVEQELDEVRADFRL